MQVLVHKNEHLEEKTSIQEYGCECPNCGTVFIFDITEVSKPRMLNYKDIDCSIKCPNCNNFIKLNNRGITKFKNDDDKINFKMKHDE